MNKSKPELNLSECDGNAFVILGKATRVAQTAGWTEEQRKAFLKEAKSSDYDHLLRTCMEYFEVT